MKVMELYGKSFNFTERTILEIVLDVVYYSSLFLLAVLFAQGLTQIILNYAKEAEPILNAFAFASQSQIQGLAELAPWVIVQIIVLAILVFFGFLVMTTVCKGLIYSRGALTWLYFKRFFYLNLVWLIPWLILLLGIPIIGIEDANHVPLSISVILFILILVFSLTTSLLYGHFNGKHSVRKNLDTFVSKLIYGHRLLPYMLLYVLSIFVFIILLYAVGSATRANPLFNGFVGVLMPFVFFAWSRSYLGLVVKNE